MALMYRSACLILGFGVIVYACVCVALYFFQSTLIFPAYLVEVSTRVPRLKIPNAEGSTEVLIKDKGAACDAWYFGGNAEAVDLSLDALAKVFQDCNVLATVYRGYGKSTGSPSQEAFFADAVALYDERKNSYKNRRFILVGRSLGASVATYLASKVAVEQLVLVTPFDSLSHLAAQKFPWVPTRWLLKYPFASDQYAQSIKAPVHIILAEADEIIPTENTLALLNAFKHQKPELTRLAGVGHNTIDEHPKYLTVLARRL